VSRTGERKRRCLSPAFRGCKKGDAALHDGTQGRVPAGFLPVRLFPVAVTGFPVAVTGNPVSEPVRTVTACAGAVGLAGGAKKNPARRCAAYRFLRE